MEGDGGTEPAGQLNVYVLPANSHLLENPVWSAETTSGSGGWQTVQLALVPKQYKVSYISYCIVHILYSLQIIHGYNSLVNQLI